MSKPNDITYPTQYDCTKIITETIPDDGVLVSNLGVTSWTLSAVDDRDLNYYMKGAMGTTTTVGLGLALSRDEQVTVLDGDGSLLMSLGTLTTISRQAAENLVIIVMNNSAFATTGGQLSLATEINFSATAENCGLAGYDAASLDELQDVYEAAIEHSGPAFIDCKMETTVLEEYPNPDYAHSYRKHQFRTALLDNETLE